MSGEAHKGALYPGEREERDALRIARATAIERDATLEQSLCRLFAALTSATPERAATVFFRLSNFRSRNEIIGILLKKQFCNEYV
ncbi:MAG: hypothetical protein ACREDJ_06485, partial [Methylocella sp.]